MICCCILLFKRKDLCAFVRMHVWWGCCCGGSLCCFSSESSSRWYMMGRNINSKRFDSRLSSTKFLRKPYNDKTPNGISRSSRSASPPPRRAVPRASTCWVCARTRGHAHLRLAMRQQHAFDSMCSEILQIVEKLQFHYFMNDEIYPSWNGMTLDDRGPLVSSSPPLSKMLTSLHFAWSNTCESGFKSWWLGLPYW